MNERVTREDLSEGRVLQLISDPQPTFPANQSTSALMDHQVEPVSSARWSSLLLTLLMLRVDVDQRSVKADISFSSQTVSCLEELQP